MREPVIVDGTAFGPVCARMVGRKSSRAKRAGSLAIKVDDGQVDLFDTSTECVEMGVGFST